MEPLSMPPVSQRCPCLYTESMLPTFSHHSPLCSCLKEVETWVGHSSVILTLHVGHSRTGTGLSTLWSSPSTLYSFVEYLMLDDGGCLNALLPSDFIPSTPDHLESRVIFECLETCSHQWQVLSPSTVFENTLMSPNRWILSSVDINTSIRTC